MMPKLAEKRNREAYLFIKRRGTGAKYSRFCRNGFSDMHLHRHVVFVALSVLCVWGARAAIAAPNRLLFANQSDFGAKQGFYLDLENDSSGDQPCKLATLRLIFAVGDGKS